MYMHIKTWCIRKDCQINRYGIDIYVLNSLSFTFSDDIGVNADQQAQSLFQEITSCKKHLTFDEIYKVPNTGEINHKINVKI